MAFDMDTVLAAKEAAVERFFSLEGPLVFSSFAATSRIEHNVVGIGVGPKSSDGEPGNDLSVRFYVEHKLPMSAVGSGSMLPKEIDGVPTDVVETGRFRRFPTAPVAPQAAVIPNRTKKRPIQPGLSCGFKFPSGSVVMAGTLGCIVQDANALYILSNNHVLADEGKLQPGSPIFQPGLLDGGKAATDKVARLSRFIPITASHVNQVDCAIARLDPQDIADPTFMPQVGKLSTAKILDPAVDLKVMKTGRTTGFTRGVITDIHVTVKVEYEVGICQFNEQIMIIGTGGQFSDSGDSGSIIVSEDHKQATGLLFAGSASHTIANRLDAVLAALGVSLVV